VRVALSSDLGKAAARERKETECGGRVSRDEAMHENVKLTEDGRHEVLGLVRIALPGTWWWRTEDLNESSIKGAIFRCYEEGNDRELAYLLIGDVSNDLDEPDVANLAQESVGDLDKFLEREIRQLMARDGRRMIKWMSSQLNGTVEQKALVTAYIAEDDGRERQYIDLRIPVRGRKVVVAGCFDVGRTNELAVPVFTALREASIFTPRVAGIRMQDAPTRS
jgi:hypothetical protein